MTTTLAATPDYAGMHAVTQDEWAEYLADFPIYQTKSYFGAYNIMYSKLSQNHGSHKPGYVIAEVHYLPNDERVYFIR